MQAVYLRPHSTHHFSHCVVWNTKHSRCSWNLCCLCVHMSATCDYMESLATLATTHLGDIIGHFLISKTCITLPTTNRSCIWRESYNIHYYLPMCRLRSRTRDVGVFLNCCIQLTTNWSCMDKTEHTDWSRTPWKQIIIHCYQIIISSNDKPLCIYTQRGHLQASTS